MARIITPEIVALMEAMLQGQIEAKAKNWRNSSWRHHRPSIAIEIEDDDATPPQKLVPEAS